MTCSLERRLSIQQFFDILATFDCFLHTAEDC